MIASPVEPAPNVNSASSGSVVENSNVSVPMIASMTRVVRSVGSPHAYRNPSRNWRGALALRADGWSWSVRIRNMAVTTAT